MKELVQFLVQQLVNQPDAPPSQMNAHGSPRRTRRRPPHPTPVGQKPPSHRKGGVIAEHKAHYVQQRSRGAGQVGHSECLEPRNSRFELGRHKNRLMPSL